MKIDNVEKIYILFHGTTKDIYGQKAWIQTNGLRSKQLYNDSYMVRIINTRDGSLEDIPYSLFQDRKKFEKVQKLTKIMDIP